MPDGIDKELEITQFHLEQMFKTMSFFTGFSEESLKESEFIDKIAAIYYASVAALHGDEDNFEMQHEFNWNNELWTIAHPELKHGDKMKFGELLDAKQTIQNMADLGKNRWECMMPLAAIFLRRKDEAYEESFLYEGSDRLKMMENLPMNIAMCIGFFLTGSLSLYTEISQSSHLLALKEAEEM